MGQAVSSLLKNHESGYDYNNYEHDQLRDRTRNLGMLGEGVDFGPVEPKC